MKKLIKSIKDFGRKNPARIYTFASIFSVYLSKRVPGLPMEVTILTITALFGLGEGVQRIENKKTTEALFEKPPKGKKHGKASRKGSKSSRNKTKNNSSKKWFQNAGKHE